jgi:single-strand DNA-binding protein
MASKKNQPSAPESTEAQKSEKVSITGWLLYNPTLRHTANGRPVTNLVLGVSQPEGAPEFHRVVVWNKTAEAICQHLTKGREVTVDGFTTEREYEVDGEKRQATEIVAFKGGVQFLNRKPRETEEKQVA